MPIYEATVFIRFVADDAVTARDNLLLVGEAIGSVNLDEALLEQGITSTDITLGTEVTDVA